MIISTCKNGSDTIPRRGTLLDPAIFCPVIPDDIGDIQELGGDDPVIHLELPPKPAATGVLVDTPF